MIRNIVKQNGPFQQGSKDFSLVYKSYLFLPKLKFRVLEIQCDAHNKSKDKTC